MTILEKLHQTIRPIFESGVEKLSYYDELNVDYKATRDAIKAQLDLIGGWNDWDQDQRIIACKWFLVSKMQTTSVLNSDDYSKYSLFYHNMSMASREKRYSAMVALWFRELDKMVVLDLLVEIEHHERKYIKFGVEGTSEGDSMGLYDWIDNDLRVKTGLVGSPDLNAVADASLIILRGNY